ncbi:MAG: hypothetical protein KC416_10715, partial [Myxococcales bacterium]|nr:hypothetical protein [Myxococcales bacterium]
MSKQLSALLSLLLLAACGASPGVGEGTTPEKVSAERLRAEMAKEKAEKERRIRELEGQLALAHAESRDLRSEVRRRQEAPRASVRIGARAPEPENTWSMSGDDLAEDDGPRPLLRLYGSSSPTTRSVPPLI